jgi:ABC-2 type transport system ATP-binding protein
MPTIECNALTKRYGKVEALRGLTFAVEGGGCVGFLGPNGAGKTTTIRILTGLASPTGGQAMVDGLDVVAQPDRVRSRIGYLAQSPAFYNYMTAEEFLRWTARLFHLDEKTARSRTEELLKRLGLWDARRRSIGGYSGGMRQRLGLAQAMINQPKILFLDEPVSALDPIGRHEILSLIDEWKTECTIFMSSHVLADVERVSDRVIIVNQGRIAADATMDQLREQYAAPVFIVEVGHHDPDLTVVLQAEPYVAGVRREGAQYRVAARDVAAARARLPRRILETGATLIRYEVEAPTLEDIFLKVVNGHEPAATAD